MTNCQNQNKCATFTQLVSASDERHNRLFRTRIAFPRVVAACAIKILVTSMIAPASLWAASPAYNYQVVAKSGDVIDGIPIDYLSTPFISNDETVLFLGGSPAVNAMFATHIASGKKRVVIKQGDSIDGYVVNQIVDEKRNDRGEIVFSTTLAGGDGLFTLKAPVVVPGQTIGGLPVYLYSGFSLNNKGEIVFAALINDVGTGIFTPNKVVITNGATIGGVTLKGVYNPALSASGVVAFNGLYSISSTNYDGIFTRKGTVVKSGDSVSGLTLFTLGAPAISTFGVIGYEGTSLIKGSPSPNLVRAFFIDHSRIAQTGDTTIDGLTLQAPGDPLAPRDTFNLNAGGEALFSSNATNANGAATGGWFTAKHSVVAIGDTVAGISVDNVYGATMNDRGQVAVVVSYTGGTALIVATPVDGTPLPANTTYKIQDATGNIIDLGWALNPDWGAGPYAYLYPFNSSVTQQVTYTADHKLQSVQDPTMYLYNDGGYLALGPNGDTFTIDQSLGAYTVKDGDLYLQSPGTTSPPNALTFTSSPAYWSFMNASPTNSNL
jgi:hypothetical protein